MSYVITTILAVIVWFIGAVIVGQICTLLDGPDSRLPGKGREFTDHSPTSHLLVLGWNFVSLIGYVLVMLNL